MSTTLNYQYRADYHQGNANMWRARRQAEEGLHGHTALATAYLEYELHEAHLAAVERFAGKSLGQVVDDPPEGSVESTRSSLSQDNPDDVSQDVRPAEATTARLSGIVGTPAHTDDLSRELPETYRWRRDWSQAANAILGEVLHERERQAHQLGYGVEHDDRHDELTWHTLLLQRATAVAEMLSAVAAITDPSDRRATARGYLVQTAAVAVAWIEALDRLEDRDGQD